MTSSQWRAAGAALESLDRLSVLLLVGDSIVSLAATARGVADGSAGARRVAIFDLAGAFGLFDHDGLVAAFREGRSQHALAGPLCDGEDNCFVVPRGPGQLDDAFARHERWPRLVAGFRDTGALLIIAARSDFAGLDSLSQLADQSLCLLEREDSSRLVQWPPSDADLFADFAPPPAPRDTIPSHVELMSESAPTDFAPPGAGEVTEAIGPPPPFGEERSLEEELAEEQREEPVWAPDDAPPDPTPRKSPPPLVRITPASTMSRIRARRRISWVALGTVLILSMGGWYWARGRGRNTPGANSPQSALATNTVPAALPDSAFTLPALINPGDSARSSAWAVELVATNDRTDALSRLEDNNALAAATVSPVLLGADGGTWFKVIVGAYVDRAGAEYMRATLRQGGTIDAEAGVVARAPYALRLDHGLTRDAAKARVVRYVARGVAAYALIDDSSRASVYTGAFASPDQAVILLAELRAAGIEPALAYRVGRTF